MNLPMMEAYLRLDTLLFSLPSCPLSRFNVRAAYSGSAVLRIVFVFTPSGFYGAATGGLREEACAQCALNLFVH